MPNGEATTIRLPAFLARMFSTETVVKMVFWAIILIWTLSKWDQRLVIIENWMKDARHDQERVSTLLQQLSENQARQTAILDQLEKRIDRVEAKKP